MTEHARLAPSDASRWLRCPGSINFTADIEEGEAGVPADEGTILHTFCESALREGKDAYDYIGEVREHNGYKLELTEELAELMQPGLDRIDTFPGKLVIEHKVDLKRWMPGQFGTLDVGIVGKKRIVIWDWKWGYNPVHAVDNDQLRIYALGFWDNVARHVSKAEDFLLIIEQPRSGNGGGEWKVTLEELLDFGSDLKKAAARTYDADAPRIPGPKQCAYCAGAKGLKCREYSDFNLQMIVDDFDELDQNEKEGFPPRFNRGITPERRSYIIEHRAMINKYLDRLEADALDDAIKGRPTPGLKAVLGRNPARKWREEDQPAVEAFLTRALDEEAYTRKLVSPTGAEKLLPPKLYQKVSGYVDKGIQKTILVSVHDSRPPVPTVAELFDDD